MKLLSSLAIREIQIKPTPKFSLSPFCIASKTRKKKLQTNAVQGTGNTDCCTQFGERKLVQTLEKSIQRLLLNQNSRGSVTISGCPLTYQDSFVRETFARPCLSQHLSQLQPMQSALVSVSRQMAKEISAYAQCSPLSHKEE